MPVALWTLVVAVLAAWAAPPAPPTLTVAARARGLHPGEVVILTITSDVPLITVRAHAVGRALAPAQVAGGWRVLVGLDLDAAPGPQAVQIEATSQTGTATTTHTFAVTARAFPTRRLNVDPDFVNPPAAMAARIASEGRDLTALWEAPPTEPRSAELTFAPPVPHRANSAFGTRSVFNGEPRGAHGGADFLSPAGTPVQAPAPGTVVLARDLYYTGGTVIIDHGLGIFSLFAHLSATTAAAGDVVERGAVVGRVGATGRVTGAHLHWTVRLGGARVDPFALLELLPVTLSGPR